jgi:hypothetical protein
MRRRENSISSLHFVSKSAASSRRIGLHSHLLNSSSLSLSFLIVFSHRRHSDANDWHPAEAQRIASRTKVTATNKRSVTHMLRRTFKTATSVTQALFWLFARAQSRPSTSTCDLETADQWSGSKIHALEVRDPEHVIGVQSSKWLICRLLLHASSQCDCSKCKYISFD